MSNACLPKKSSKKNSKARLPPKRGQIKVGIFRWVVKKAAGIASMAGLGRKSSCVPDKPASATPLQTSTCPPAKQE
ncbi:hypothetical protein ACJRO7_028892 [Eucalyptus globulus]|uniref:Uncharacterized protein n=1 Tax=Eucalyptus globulus TaxID=34317 RepID=A0ABD3JYJ1_EUCGL